MNGWDKAKLLAIMFTSASSNATLASLIEISYPVFVALFALLLFNENNLTPSAVISAVLVFVGVVVTIIGNR